MVDLSLEGIHARPVWEMTLRCESQRQKEVFTGCSSAILRLDFPLPQGLVELRANHSGVKGSVLFDLQLPFDMVKVLLELFRARITT